MCVCVNWEEVRCGVCVMLSMCRYSCSSALSSATMYLPSLEGDVLVGECYHG
jgi:hypothetical protein